MCGCRSSGLVKCATRGPRARRRAPFASAVASHALALLQLADFVAEARGQGGPAALINPVERNTVGGELARLLGGDALKASLVRSPSGHIGPKQPRHLKSGEDEHPPRERQAIADVFD